MWTGSQHHSSAAKAEEQCWSSLLEIFIKTACKVDWGGQI